MSEHLVLLSQEHAHANDQIMTWMRDAGYGAGQARSEVRILAADRSPSSQQPQVSASLTFHCVISRHLLCCHSLCGLSSSRFYVL